MTEARTGSDRRDRRWGLIVRVVAVAGVVLIAALATWLYLDGWDSLLRFGRLGLWGLLFGVPLVVTLVLVVLTRRP